MKILYSKWRYCIVSEDTEVSGDTKVSEDTEVNDDTKESDDTEFKWRYWI